MKKVYLVKVYWTVDGKGYSTVLHCFSNSSAATAYLKSKLSLEDDGSHYCIEEEILLDSWL